MAVTIKPDSMSKHLHINKTDKSVHRLTEYLPGPTMTMENVVSGVRGTGTVDCANFESYVPVDECSKEDLIDAIKVLTEEAFPTLAHSEMMGRPTGRVELEKQLIEKDYQLIGVYNQLIKLREENVDLLKRLTLAEE